MGLHENLLRGIFAYGACLGSAILLLFARCAIGQVAWGRRWLRQCALAGPWPPPRPLQWQTTGGLALAADGVWEAGGIRVPRRAVAWVARVPARRRGEACARGRRMWRAFGATPRPSHLPRERERGRSARTEGRKGPGDAGLSPRAVGEPDRAAREEEGAGRESGRRRRRRRRAALREEACVLGWVSAALSGCGRTGGVGSASEREGQ